VIKGTTGDKMEERMCIIYYWQDDKDHKNIKETIPKQILDSVTITFQGSDRSGMNAIINIIPIILEYTPIQRCKKWNGYFKCDNYAHALEGECAIHKGNKNLEIESISLRFESVAEYNLRNLDLIPQVFTRRIACETQCIIC